MALRDHAAHTRLPVCNQAPDPGNDWPPDLDLELEKLESYAAKLAGISWAIHVVRALLERSEAFKQRHDAHLHDPAKPWPFNPVQTTGLHAAMYFLQQYADTLIPPESNA